MTLLHEAKQQIQGSKLGQKIGFAGKFFSFSWQCFFSAWGTVGNAISYLENIFDCLYGLGDFSHGHVTGSVDWPTSGTASRSPPNVEGCRSAVLQRLCSSIVQANITILARTISEIQWLKLGRKSSRKISSKLPTSGLGVGRPTEPICVFRGVTLRKVERPYLENGRRRTNETRRVDRSAKPLGKFSIRRAYVRRSRIGEFSKMRPEKSSASTSNISETDSTTCRFFRVGR